MFKYNNIGAFVNNSIDYPFNIINADGVFIEDFWVEINNQIGLINNEERSKIRYIWIDAGDYCQTEIFLKNLLYQHHGDYPVLYLHWIDFANKDRSIYHQLSQEQMDGKYFINNPNVIKICVIDHVETIDQIDQYLELCRKLYENKCIFIFVAKKDKPSILEWEKIVKMASRTSDDNDCYLGILRSEKNYYIVKPYSFSQCENIFSIAIKKNDIRSKVISMVDTLGEELRRPYYFDFLINELNKYKDVTEMPDKLDDSNLILKIFSNSLDGIISHLKGFESFKEYLDGYYDSNFVNSYRYGEHSRIPFDNYAWAYGIMFCSNKNKYEDIISTQFEYSNSKKHIEFKGQLGEINERIVLLFYSDKIQLINKNFELKDYFLQMVNHSLASSKLCASVLNKCFEKIDTETCEIVFKALGKRYNKSLVSKEEICVHYLLGMEIGKLFPKVSNNCILEGLDYIFNCVNDDYVEPQCNDKGISVIPVTNFEFEKFVRNGGYASFYSMDTDKSFNEIAIDYYKDIFNFIIDALSGNNRKDSNCLARLLKGYGWNHYKQIAYLFSRREDINSATIYNSISAYYPDKILNPAKWVDERNSDVLRPFCNPLQPVICVNIYEARAYTNWLASKIKKPVRLLNYDPDYLSIIGINEKSKLRQSFRSHIEKNRDFINSVENDELFYGKNDIKVKEPSPVAMPNSKYLGIYDFVGNIFETQDTPFTYNYIKNNRAIKREDVLIDYNCPGGGLQRTAANWPPEYMGQVPAFLRNQDIGFRIVIGTHDIGSQEHKSSIIEHTKYLEHTIEMFTCTNEGQTSVFDHIHLDYSVLNNEFEQDFLRSNVFFNKEKSAVVYMKKAVNHTFCKEAILLIQNGQDIFAYHLIGLASTFNNENCHKNNMKMLVRKPIVPKDLVSRKKKQNSSCAEWISLIELYNDSYVEFYSAYPINISNGFFQIANRNVRYQIQDGRELKKHSMLSNSYLICFNADSQNYKHTYYESYKEKLGADFFLPDWIDIVDFIYNICNNMSFTLNALDVETVMAAITTIDTADLHEQINKKMLYAKEHNK